MADGDMHVLFQQMGEVLSGVRGLRDTIDIRQAQAEQLHDLLRSDISSLRRDHRDLEEKFDCMLLLAQHDLDMLRNGSAEHSKSIAMLASALETLRRPINQMLAIKSRLVGLLFVSGVLGSGALWLIEPVYRWFIDAALPRH